MNITSSAFRDGEEIPTSYTQEGEDSNPPLTITDVPPEAKSLALIVDDPDAPKGTVTHWVVFNINPRVGVILDNTVPLGALEGVNLSGEVGFRGPKPPSGTHRYFFRIFALDTTLPLLEGASRAEVDRAMKDHVLASAELIGRYTAEKDRAESPPLER